MVSEGEKIVEKKICRISGEEFFVTDKDVDFYQKVSPVLGGERYDIPSPTISPYERFIAKVAWRNERNLFHRKCDLTGEDIISMYHPDLPHVVYGKDVWWTDQWTHTAFARDPDWSRPFFDQFNDLFQTTPLLALSVLLLENSDFNNCAGNLKNCYLCFDVDYLEECYYLGNSIHCEHCFDCDMIQQSQFCYDCFNCAESRNLIHCVDCRTSHDLIFCQGCTGCSDCLFCFNQYRKTHCIYNEQYSPDEYEKKKKEILKKESYDDLVNFFRKKRYDHPHKYYHGFLNEGSTGDYIFHTKNTTNSFGCVETEDCKNCFYLFQSKNSQDHIIFGDNSNYVYNCLATGIGISTCAFNIMCWENVKNVYYSVLSNSSHDCFGCVSVRKGNHCLLNTPYSQDEYDRLTGKMIDHMRSTGEWGEFFPMKYSPYGYNETIGTEYAPLTQGEVEQRGGNWIEREVRTQESGGYEPLFITEYQESVVGQEMAKKNIDTCLSSFVVCRVSRRPFKIQPKELAYLIENNLPIPTLHPEIRHKRRNQSYQGGVRFYSDTCGKCAADVITPHTGTGENGMVIYCEECYQKEVY